MRIRTGTAPLTDAQRLTLQATHDRLDALLASPIVGLLLRDATMSELREVRDSLRDSLQPSALDNFDWL